MARALTGDELTYLRRDGQRCALYLAIHTPETVFTARVNGVPASNDKVAEITYDGGSAGYGGAIAGMTVYVGSSAGAFDKGMVRLRGTLSGSSGTMGIGETSEINWTDDDYLTVVDEFGLWPRHVRITDAGVVYMDYEVAYSDQHENMAPVAVMGPPAVKWLTGATVDVDFDASDSWVLGSSISTYSWVAPGSDSVSGGATATPTITYSAAGVYRVKCTVTAANGAGVSGYRYVFIFDDSNPPLTAFRLDSCAGDWESGGWSFQVTAWDDVLKSEVRDRAMVALFAKDWYGATEVSIGPIADRENVIAVGWIAGESIEWDPEQGNVSFRVEGPQYWLGQMTGFPSGVEDYNGTPTGWTEIEGLTADKGLWHVLHWRTTATVCIDVVLTGDDREIAVFNAPPDTIWNQIAQEAENTILARPCCDRYGRLFVEVDLQIVPEADRSGVPTVMALTTGDWRAQIHIERQTVPPAAMVDLSGVQYSSGAGTPRFSLSLGHVPARHGVIERRERLALSSQAQANSLAGLVLGKLQNEFPVIDIPLAGMNRAVDVCPHQYVSLTIDEGDTERGVVWSSVKLLPRRVNFEHDAAAGVLQVGLECERETFEAESSNGDIPAEPPSPPAPPPPPPAPLPPDPPIYRMVAVWSYNQLAFSFDFFEESSPTWVDASTGLSNAGVIFNLVVNKQREAWLVSHNAVDLNASGVFYCADVMASTPLWTLILSTQDAKDEAEAVAGGTSGGGFFSIGLVDTDETYEGTYVVMLYTLSPYPLMGYWLITGASPSAIVPLKTNCTQHQFSVKGVNDWINSGVGPVVVVGGYGNYDAAGHITAIPLDEMIQFTYGVNNTRTVYAPSHNFCSDGGAKIDNYTVDMDTALYSGVDTDYPVEEKNGAVFYLDSASDDLYKDGVQFAENEDVFGVGCVGGGYVTVDDADHVVWVCNSAYAASPDKVVAYTEDGGGTWVGKDGDLETVVGNWAGGSSAAGVTALAHVVVADITGDYEAWL